MKIRLLAWLIVLLLGMGWQGVSSANAAILYTADSSGAVLVQSRWSLRDTDRHSWQVIAFKQVQPDGREAGIVLRLVGFPNVVELTHPQPIAFVDLQGRARVAADCSDQIISNQTASNQTAPNQTTISAPSHVGQYDLQSVLLQLPLERLQLQMSLRNAPEASIRISPAMLEEWQQVASVSYSDLQQACQKFPVEARQNPAFPAWVGCSAE